MFSDVSVCFSIAEYTTLGYKSELVCHKIMYTQKVRRKMKKVGKHWSRVKGGYQLLAQNNKL